MKSRAFILGLALLAAILLASAAALRVSYWSYGADTGTLAIATQNVPNGMFDQFEHASHFRFHWSPILALLYPLLALTRSVLALQIAQVLLVIGAVIAFYFLVEHYAGAKIALRAAIVALIYPPLVGLAFSEFHELAFAPLLTFCALLALAYRKWLWYGVSVLLLLCVKEDVALIAALCGAVLAAVGMRRDDRALMTAGVLTSVSAAAVVLVYFSIVIPRLGGWGPVHFYDAPYDYSIAGRVTYVLEMLVPLALLPLRTRWFFLVLPGLAIVLLANSGEVWRMGMHYVALWLPWVLIAMAAGLVSIQMRWGQQIALRWANVAVAACVVFLLVANPLHLEHYLRPSYADIPSVNRVLSCVPTSETLGTHDEWYSAIAFTHPNETIGAPDSARYLLFADDYPNAEYQATTRTLVRHELAAGQLKEVCRSHAVAVYRRQP